MGQVTLPATTARHSSINARTDAERDKREVRFFLYLGGMRPSCSWILAYVELEQIKGDNISKLASFPNFNLFFFSASLFSWRPRRAVSVLLRTTNCSTWRGESSRDPSYEVGEIN